jgi:hypothetical protein
MATVLKFQCMLNKLNIEFTTIFEMHNCYNIWE